MLPWLVDPDWPLGHKWRLIELFHWLIRFSSHNKHSARMAITSAEHAPHGSSIKFQFSAGKSWRSNNYQKARQLLHVICLHGKHQRALTEGMANATPSQQPRKWPHYLCSFRCEASTITGLPQIMLQHLSSYVPDKTCVEKAVYRSLSINPQAKGSSRQQSSAVPATEPVAVIPLA